MHADIVLNLERRLTRINVLVINTILYQFLIRLVYISYIKENGYRQAKLPDFSQTLDSSDLIPIIAFFTIHISNENEIGRWIIEEKLVFL